jgi:hypothetical protein
MGDAPKTRAQTLAEIREAATSRHNRKVKARIPLYTKAILALKAEIVAGRDPRDAWVKELAPLTAEERELCRTEVWKRHAAPAPEAATR